MYRQSSKSELITCPRCVHNSDCVTVYDVQEAYR